MPTFKQELRMQRGLLPLLIGLGCVIAVAGPAAVAVLGLTDASSLKELDAYLLPVLLIGGIVMFLVALCVVVTVFRKLGLASTTYALGLPEGSIRAFIALALILLFFMMGIYLYTGIAQPEQVLTGLTEQEANAIPADRVAFRVPRGAVVDVHLNSSSSAGEDVARQMITTMSTLVVAIASFYFGTSSVQQAFTTTSSGAIGGTTALALEVLEPQNMPRSLRRREDGGWEPETVRLRCSPPEARIVGTVEGDAAVSIAAVDDSGAYTYTPTEPAGEEVRLNFTLADHKEIALSIPYRVPGPSGGGPAPAAGTDPQPLPGPDGGGGGTPDPATGDEEARHPELPEKELPERKLPDEKLPEEKLPEGGPAGERLPEGEPAEEKLPEARGGGGAADPGKRADGAPPAG